jgi:hypothetical protein
VRGTLNIPVREHKFNLEDTVITLLAPRTTFGTLATGDVPQPKPQTRYRHTAENDTKTATIKRINRWYAKRECDRCLKTGKDGITRLYVKSTGELRECFGPVDVDTFEKNFLLSA